MYVAIYVYGIISSGASLTISSVKNFTSETTKKTYAVECNTKACLESSLMLFYYL